MKTHPFCFKEVSLLLFVTVSGFHAAAGANYKRVFCEVDAADGISRIIELIVCTVLGDPECFETVGMSEFAILVVGCGVAVAESDQLFRYGI